MQLSNKVFCGFVLFLVSFSLYSQTSPQAAQDAEAAAREALRRLDATLGGNVSPGTPQAIVQPAQIARGGSQPQWVSDPYAVYDQNHFIAAVGSGSNRDEAESRALGSLVAIFGQTIRSDFAVVTMYTEAVNRGVVNVSENTNVRDQISRAASMDNVIGAQIGSIWDSGRGTIHAVAYMDRAKTISIYSDLIIVNNRNIDLLTNMSDTEKNSLDGFARYRLASQIAGINTNYAAVVTQAGGSTSALNLRSADYFSLEAANIIRNITVTVDVSNDRANRVQDAFARVLNAENLRTRGNNPRYTLEVRLDVNEVSFPGNAHIFCRIEGSANLIDNHTGASLLPFSFNERTGHTTYANAEAAAFLNVERLIAQRYPALLREFLASLIPAF
ncbi:MAG: LPP20 family lipoprotein [Treponema sp.]|jgi:hypothetical protein|nr:LPP20 family lipoprotein [Treponema sp.]